MIELIFLAGFAGGVIRGFVGFLKYQYSYKDVPFRPWRFLSLAGISGLVGLMAALAFREVVPGVFETPSLSPVLFIIIGYAGGDFLENIAKMILRKPDLYTKR